MSTLQRRFVAALGLACAAALWITSTRLVPRAPRTGSIAERALGPLAPFAAAVQWTRADLALRRGEWTRAYALSESALELDSRTASGWIYLAHHFVFERASLSLEPDRHARERWIRAGLDLLERGAARAEDAGEVWLYRGAVMAFQASLSDEDRAWPASAREAWLGAAENFQRAAEHGHPDAADAEARARELADR